MRGDGFAAADRVDPFVGLGLDADGTCIDGKDVGKVTYDAAARTYGVDPDGAGPAAAFSVDAEDFNTPSLRGNAVLRWEYRPGSTLFVVWQQRRSGTMPYGDFDFSRDTRSIFDARADNVFVLKFNYWLNL